MRAPAWLLAMMCALGPVSASASVIHVDAGGGGDFLTIQAGIDAASEGDTVLVAAGTYTGSGNRDLSFGGTNMTLASESGAAHTTINCQGSASEHHRGFRFDNGEDSASAVVGFTVTAAYADSGGGAVLIAASPRFEECAFNGNTAGTGGALSARSSSLVLRRCTLSLNQTRAGNGGAVWCAYSSVAIDSCGFSRNTSFSSNYDDGGAICARFSTGEITGSTFDANSAANVGAVYCISSPLSFASCTFTSNESDDLAGAVGCAGSGSPSCSACSFDGNFALGPGGGGAVAVWDGCEATFTACEFHANGIGGAVGGAVRCTSGKVFLVECTLSGNRASHGGALYIENGSVAELHGCVLTDSNVWSQGGAISIQSSSATLTGCSVRRCSATSGGAVRCWESVVSMVDCVVAENSALIEGGGLGCLASTLATLDGCTFLGNDGSAVFSESSSVNMSGCVFLGNAADDPWTTERGGAVSCVSSSATLTGCTIVASSSPTGGAVFCDDSSPSLQRTVIASGSSGPALYCEGDSAPESRQCCIFGNAGGDSLCGTHHGNLFESPLFCSLADTNLALHSDSPCLPDNNPWGELIGAYGDGGCGTGVPEDQLPHSLTLASVTANPFRDTCRIECDIPADAGIVRVALYDVVGRCVRVLADGPRQPGRNALTWDGIDDAGRPVASGVYFCRVTAGSAEVSAKLVLIR